MSLVAGGIPSFGLTGLLIPYIAGPFYFARPENRYAQVLHPLIPKWLHPQSDYAIVKLYEGLREGQPVPWGEWFGPLAVWTLLAFIMYGAFFCLYHPPAQALGGRREAGLSLAAATGGDVELRGVGLAAGVSARQADVGVLRGALRDPCPQRAPPVRPGDPDDQRPRDQPRPVPLPAALERRATAVHADPVLDHRPGPYVLPSELSFSLWFFYFFFLSQTVVAERDGVADARGAGLRNQGAGRPPDVGRHPGVGGREPAGGAAAPSPRSSSRPSGAARSLTTPASRSPTAWRSTASAPAWSVYACGGRPPAPTSAPCSS